MSNPAAEKSKGPKLPSRYEEVLNQRITAEAGRIAASAQAAGAATRVPKWGMPVAFGGLALTFALALMGRTEAREGNRVAFDRSAVISAGTVGARADAEDLIPPSPSPEPQAPTSDFVSQMDLHERAAAAPEHRHEADPRPSAPRRPAARPAPSPSPECTSCKKVADAAEAELPPVEASPLPDPGPSPSQAAALAEALRPVLNVGSRFTATLDFPVNTAFAGAPATAHLQKDLTVDGRVAIPAGARLVGEAFATHLDDRAQIVFTAIVHEGRTIPLRGMALGPDNQLGVAGKVIRKASATKKGVGRVLGSIGHAVSLGLIGRGDGVLEEAGAIMASQTASDLSQLERAWSVQRSDKVVEIRAGTTVTVYVQGDVRVPLVP